MSFVLKRSVAEMGGGYARRWWALGVLCLSLLAVVMANTSLIVAAPDMTESLQLSSTDLQWVMDGYTVPYAALMLLFGVLGDRFGRRKALVAGLVLFGIGSIFGSFAESTVEVISWRIVMGVGAAVIMPATLSLLVATFPKVERTRAIAIWAATSGLGIAMGPLLVGALLNQGAWSTAFLVNVPIVATAIVGCLWLVPPSRVHDAGPIDWVGGILSVFTVGALVYAVIDGLHSDWDTLPSVLGITALAGIVLFVLWEWRHPSPLLDIRSLGSRKVGGAVLAVALLFLTAFGVIYFVPQHFQFVLGYGPFETGLRLLPLAAAVTVGSVLSGRVMARVGEKWLIAGGMLISAAGVLVLTQVDADSGYPVLALVLTLLGFGMGLAEPPATDAIMSGFGDEGLGAAGGLNDTAIEFGGALGIAVLGSILATEFSDSMGDHVSSVNTAELPEQLRDQAHAAVSVAQESVGAAAGVTEHLASDTILAPFAAPLHQAAASAFSDAIHAASWVGGGILLVGAAVVFALLPRHESARESDEQAGTAKQLVTAS